MAATRRTRAVRLSGVCPSALRIIDRGNVKQILSERANIPFFQFSVFRSDVDRHGRLGHYVPDHIVHQHQRNVIGRTVRIWASGEGKMLSDVLFVIHEETLG